MRKESERVRMPKKYGRVKIKVWSRQNITHSVLIVIKIRMNVLKKYVSRVKLLKPQVSYGSSDQLTLFLLDHYKKYIYTHPR